MNDLITLKQVKELWTIPGKKAPCTTTIWRYRRQGKVPDPIQAGRDNLYKRADVIRLRNEALNISND